jgi:hypothetical protein
MKLGAVVEPGTINAGVVFVILYSTSYFPSLFRYFSCFCSILGLLSSLIFIFESAVARTA